MKGMEGTMFTWFDEANCSTWSFVCESHFSEQDLEAAIAGIEVGGRLEIEA